MSAVYGVRFTCDNCGAESAVWAGGNQPSIYKLMPSGWMTSNYAYTGIKPTYQRPHVCPACRPELEAWEAGRKAHDDARNAAIRGAYEDALRQSSAWGAANPAPKLVLPFRCDA